MAATWLSSGGKPFPWGVKPSVPEIDWSNPLTEALSFDANYFMFAGPVNMEGVTGQKSAITGAVSQIGPWGPQRSFSGGSSTDSDLYTLPASLQNTNNLLSVEALVYLNAYSTGGGFGRLIDKGGTTSQLFRIFCEDGSNTINFIANFSGGDCQNSYNLPAGSWQHIVMVYDRSVGTNTPAVYINGFPVNLIHNTTTSGTPTPDAASIGIGNRQQQDRAWNGYISHVRTWNRLLSQSEALALYQNPWQVYRVPASPMALSGGGSYTLGAARGAINETGGTASLKVARLLSAAQGGVGLAGQAATLQHGYRLLAGQGSFAEVGAAALFGIKMPVVQGSFALSGGTANLVWTVGGAHSFALTSAAGSLVLMGQSAAVKAGCEITAANGAISLVGTAASLARGKKLGAIQGNFALSGKSAGFRAALSVKAQCGTLMLAPEAAELKKSGWSAADPSGAVWVPQISGAQAWSPATGGEVTWTSN